MRTIYKYQLNSDEGYTELSLPKYSRLLTIQMQHGSPCLWCEVDTKEPLEQYIVIALGTGHDLSYVEGGMYIATCQDGPYVYHYYIKRVDERSKINE